MTLYYDTLNRLNRLSINTGANAYYGYDPSNQRVYYRDPGNTEWIYFYGVDGKKLAVFQTAGFPTVNGALRIQFTQQPGTCISRGSWWGRRTGWARSP